MSAEPTALVATTDDLLFAGRLRLRQPARGHRAGSDAVLLAAACPAGARRVVDLGCGAGTVGLRVAQVEDAAEVCLVDRDPALLALTNENAGANGLAARCRTVAGDCLDRRFAASGAGLSGWAEVVLTNPPFYVPGAGTVSPERHKAGAHVLSGDLRDWVKGGLRCLAPRGTIVLIHRADALVSVIEALGGRFGGLKIRPVHPRAEAPAHRMLVLGRRGSRAAPVILPPLVLHGPDGRFTPLAAALHEGTARLAWE
ncbi:MAG TPA: methyltransferase [Beijerinckiaceae bacterium]|nr:methyltransferase [Beijerinckiaceae bacterium]